MSRLMVVVSLVVCGAVTAAAAGGGAAATAKKRVLTVDECIRAHHKPRSIEGICGGRHGYGPYVSGIKWASYDGRSGEGTAKVSPGIAAGDPNFYRAQIRVFRPRPCKRIGSPIFTRMEWRFTDTRPAGHAQRGKHRFHCRDLASR